MTSEQEYMLADYKTKNLDWIMIAQGPHTINPHRDQIYTIDMGYILYDDLKLKHGTKTNINFSKKTSHRTL